MAFPKLDFPWREGDGENENRSDYRAVPASDRGNDGYHDKGGLGTYQTDATWFRNPAGVKIFDGFGASQEELHRGWCDPGIEEGPEYELANYKYRSSEPKGSDLHIFGEGDRADFAFRERNRRSAGFFPRPKLPTER